MVQSWERVARQRITQSFSPNPEILFPPLGEDEGTEDPMIIEAEIGGHCVHRMYVDGGLASEILYEHCFSRLRPEIKKQLIPATTPLIGFSGETIWPIGQIQLLVAIGDEEHSASAWMNFMVVRSSSPYNGIIGRPGVRKLQAVPSTAHEMLKILVEGGVITLKSSKLVPLECAVVFGPEGAPSATKPIIEERIKVAINPEYPEQTVMIGSTLTEEGRNKLCELLQRNLDIFAWKPADITGVPRHIAEHRLNVREGCSSGINRSELKYTSWKRLELALVHLGMRLKRYFQAHPIIVITDQPIQQILSRLEIAGRLQKWSIELGEYAIHYRPRVSVKGQILADFIVERPEEDSPTTLDGKKEEAPLTKDFVYDGDGSSCIDGFGAGLILTNPEGMEFTYALRFRFDATNNEAEYEALIAGLRIAEQMGVKNLQANVDSRLVANQVNGTYVAKEADMIRYLEKVKALTGSFKAFTIKQIPRSENKKADALSKIASTSFAHLSKQVLVEELKEKSISEVEVLAVVEEEGDTWMTPIFKYLAEETLPTDMKKARAIRRKSWRFAVINGILYKKSFLGPWLRCVGPLQANYVLREIHEGSCSMHAGTRSVVAKALRTGYYWPTMHKDARTLIRACQDCQVHKPVPRNPQQKLTPITSPWPFYKWGIDIAGPFPEGPGKVKFLIVAMDYFTKWIEAKPVATITGNQIKKFVWDNIVCRFGLPGEIISDNGKQFRDDPFKDWCEKLCINQHFASVKHPQTNGLVERANRSLGEGIKARLEARSKNWMEELPHVLWAHRTMIKSSNGDTPFSLTYGTEAVIPAEIGMPTIRTAEVDLVQNNEALEINLDLLEERREEAAIREAKSKAKMEKYYNAKVRNTSFKPGDLVYRNNDASRAEDTGKLGPKWEGPYEVTEALGKGAYKLRDRDGKQLSQTWNISNLKKCYVHKM
ncbi:reverse transcriptase domain-containing protein [Tanacetum coccineum]